MSKIRAKFFKDGAVDKVEISIVGDPNTWIGKVTPDHTTQFAAEWDAYSRGSESVDVGGTALLDVPGITANMATALRLKGVRNAEELAALDDAAVRAIGMQGLSFRTAAKNLLAARELEELKAARTERRPRKTDDAGAVA